MLKESAEFKTGVSPFAVLLKILKTQWQKSTNYLFRNTHFNFLANKHPCVHWMMEGQNGQESFVCVFVLKHILGTNLYPKLS